MENLPMISALVGIAGVVFAAILAGVVKGAPAGNEKMREIADAISEGAIAYLNRQLITMSMTGIVIFVIIWLSIDLKTGVGFLVGAVASFIAGYVGMLVSVEANVRTAEASRKGLANGLSVAFKSGAVTGMLVAGLALLAIAVYYYLLLKFFYQQMIQIIFLLVLKIYYDLNFFYLFTNFPIFI